MHFARHISIGLMALFLGATSSSAATIVQNFTISPKTYFEQASTTSSTSDTISALFDTFDTSLGALTKIDIEFTYEFRVIVETLLADYNGAGGASGSMRINNTYSFSGAGGGNGATGSNGPISQTVFFTSDGNESLVVGPGIPVAWSNAFLNQSGPTVTIDWLPTLSATVNVPGTRVSLDRLGTSNVQLIYTYTPVPEPGSLALLCAGALFLLAHQRSNRSRLRNSSSAAASTPTSAAT